MRLMECQKREVTLRAPAARAVYTEDEQYRFETEGQRTVRAVIQPMEDKLSAQIYGQAIERMRLMLYDGAEQVAVGTGVCVETGPDGDCDYRVTAVSGWTGLTRATLTRIGEGLSAWTST